MNSYSQEYIDECRSRIDVYLSTYRSLIAAARFPAATDETPLAAAIEAFEPTFFNNDAGFVLHSDAFFSEVEAKFA